MLSKNEIKYYASLKNKKQRSMEKLFLVEGTKQVEEGLAGNWTCELVVYTPEFASSHKKTMDAISKSGIRFEMVKDLEFQKLSDTKSPQGIIGYFRVRDYELSAGNLKGPVIILDNINDPGNLGTIIRTCDWFGFSEIVLCGDSAEIYNPKVVRSTMGSLFHLNISYAVNAAELAGKLKVSGYKIYCADTEGKNYSGIEYTSRSAIVLSSESHGPEEGLLNICDEVITIPRFGKAESLNVASAAAVILAGFKLS